MFFLEFVKNIKRNYSSLVRCGIFVPTAKIIAQSKMANERKNHMRNHAHPSYDIPPQWGIYQPRYLPPHQIRQKHYTLAQNQQITAVKGWQEVEKYDIITTRRGYVPRQAPPMS